MVGMSQCLKLPTVNSSPVGNASIGGHFFHNLSQEPRLRDIIDRPESLALPDATHFCKIYVSGNVLAPGIDEQVAARSMFLVRSNGSLGAVRSEELLGIQAVIDGHQPAVLQRI